jgi:hypothetical protein
MDGNDRDALQAQLVQLQRQLSAKTEHAEDLTKLVAAAAMQARLPAIGLNLGATRVPYVAQSSGFMWRAPHAVSLPHVAAMSSRTVIPRDRTPCVQCLSVKNELEAKAALLHDCFSKLSGISSPAMWRRAYFTYRVQCIYFLRSLPRSARRACSELQPAAGFRGRRR